MNIENFIWSICDDILRDDFKRHEYGDIILPFLVLRRLDCVQEKNKDEVVKLYEDLKKILMIQLTIHETENKFFKSFKI